MEVREDLLTNQLDEEISIEEKEREAEANKMLGLFGIPTVIMAIIMTFCLYKNPNGILVPIFIVGFIAFLYLMAKKLEIKLKKGGYLYAGAMVMLGISNVLTNDSTMVFYNNFFIEVLGAGLVLYTCFSKEDWTVAKYIKSFLQLVLGTVGEIPNSFKDFGICIKNRKNNGSKNFMYITIGVLMFIPVGIILVALLTSADVVFDRMLEDTWETIFNNTEPFEIIFFFIAAFTLLFSAIRLLVTKKMDKLSSTEKEIPVAIANTFLVLISVIYVIFSFVQIYSLFLGKMTLPNGYTYAEYAREGFFELLFVCFLNLCFVLIANDFCKNNIFTKLLLTLVTVCTYIMIASSALRLRMYILMYNFTKLRLFAAWALIILTVCMTLVLVAVFYKRMKLMHCLTLTVVVGFMVLSFMRPDVFITAYNIKHATETTDFNYLAYNMSSDAVDIIKNYDDTWVDAYFREQKVEVKEKEGFRKFNLSRYNFRILIKEK